MVCTLYQKWIIFSGVFYSSKLEFVSGIIYTYNKSNGNIEFIEFHNGSYNCTHLGTRSALDTCVHLPLTMSYAFLVAKQVLILSATVLPFLV